MNSANFNNTRFVRVPIMRTNHKNNTPFFIGIGFILIASLIYFFTRKSEKKSDCVLGRLGTYTVCEPGDRCPLGKNEKAVRAIVKDHPSCPTLEKRTEYRYNKNHDCQLSEWSDWRPCEDGECNPGKNRIRTRTVTIPANEHGECTDSLREEKYIQPTTLDCILGEFGPWTQCTPDNNCPGDNNEYRTRVILQHPEGGNPCGVLTEYQRVTPVNCTTAWNPWMTCTPSANCPADMTHYRDKRIVSAKNRHGTCNDIEDKEYAIIPSWAEGKICGETSGEFCFMPFGKSCAPGKNIPQDTEPNAGHCKRAAIELAGPSVVTHNFTAFNAPPNCAFKQTGDIGYISQGDVYNSPSRFNDRTIGRHAVCFN